MNKRTLFLTFFALLLSLPCLAADQWVQVNPSNAPSARYGHSMVVISGNVYLFGGRSDTRATFFNKFWRYNPPQASWTEINAANDPPPARAGHSASVVDGKMYVMSGQGESGALADVWCYDPTANSWEDKTPGVVPPARYHHSAAVIGDAIYVFGGKDATGQPLNDLWKYDVSGNTWQERKSLPMCHRYGQGAVAIDGLMYVVGGDGGSYLYAETWAYNPSTDTWQYIDPQKNFTACVYHTCTTQNGKIYISGGQGESGRSRSFVDIPYTWMFDPATKTWTQESDGPTYAMGAAVMLDNTRNGAVVCTFTFGGTRNGTPINESWQYYVQGSPSLAITSFAPSSGKAGTSVIISGSGFTGATAVKFGGTDAASLKVDSDTQITAVVGSGSTGKVTVTTAGGTATSTADFSYGTAIPTLNEWGMIILCLLMAGIAFWILQKRKSQTLPRI